MPSQVSAPTTASANTIETLRPMRIDSCGSPERDLLNGDVVASAIACMLAVGAIGVAALACLGALRECLVRAMIIAAAVTGARATRDSL